MPTTTRSKRNCQQAELEEELLECAEAGDFDRVRELVENDRVSIECTTDYGWTPLMWGACMGRIQVVRYLIGKGANIHATDRNGDTALSLAMDDGDVEVAQLLLENDADVEARCLFGGAYYSPLGLAIFWHNVRMVALLLQFGANTAEALYQDKTVTALYSACRNANADVVQLLLDHNDGVDVNAITPRSRDNPAMTPLCQACKRNKLDIVQLLIHNGAHVVFDGVFPDSPSPLKHAVEKASLEIVRSLLDNSRFSSTSGNENPHQLPVIGRGNHPLTQPLETALKKNKLEVAQLLVDRGANVNDRAFLCMCAKVGNSEGAKLLLRADADVNRMNGSNQTPLWIAAKNGNVELVKELLKAQADVNLCDNGGEKPLEVARRSGHKGIVYLLLRTSPEAWPKLSSVL